MNPNALIRNATPADADAIQEMIQELAVYEKEPDAVRTTSADILRDGFDNSPLFHCLVVEEDGRLLGFAIYFFTWSTWEGRPSLYLEDLFIRENYRGSGLGYSLFVKLAKIAVAKNCARFEWQVLDWNKPARDFYEKLGAHHREAWLNYRIDGDELKKLSHT